MSLRRPVVLTVVLVMLAVGVLTGATAAASASAPATPAAAPLPAPAGATPAARPAAAVPSLVARSAATPATAATQGASAALAKVRPPCRVTARACVDLSAKKAWLTNGAGRIVYGPVSVLGGRRGEPTPVGTFSVSNKVRDYHSRQFDAPMPYSVFFMPGIAFHQGSLSTRSAGCLHLSRASAQRFFSELGPGDSVQVVS
ncbi:L,D-transpeptidase-like protein [Pseudonocardia sediminis]|uniref:L,D-transpeptidase-like protein n=1 Tax=Pseudonocardia sediminis TaxID=1397368 RepID=A0A4Q7USU7_PSEST|nr:L,D-transpeptidase [Pseudonocardia sediminis]RZT83908.1 L,D-transpeptidase-like protein [Pseudonocardia sediminis]